MSQIREFSSTEKESPNRFNMQPNINDKMCICGKIVITRPITLSCGHQYHFRCAREFVFSQDNDSDENKCTLCKLNNQNSSFSNNDSSCIQEEDDQEEAEEQNENMMKSRTKQNQIFQKNKKQNPFNTNSNLNTSLQTSIHNQTHEQSFKYLTPNTSKIPKSSRYSNYYDSASTQNQNQMNSFMLSPVQPSLKSPLERIPFADITKQVNQSLSPHLFSSQQKNLNNFQNEDFERNNELNFKGLKIEDLLNNKKQDKQQQISENLKNFPSIQNQNNILQKANNLNFITILGERIINRSIELQQSSYPSISYSQQQQLSNNNNNQMHENLSQSDEVFQNNFFSAMSLQSSSSLSNSSFFQNNSYIDSIIPGSKKLARMRQLLQSQQQVRCSYNSSMISNGSDKENARNITSRRTRNNILQVSFCEGVSFMCAVSLYHKISLTNSQKIPIQKQEKQQVDIFSVSQQLQPFPKKKKNLFLPFSVELSNLFNQDENNKFRNTQDILLLIVYDGLNSQQRYTLMKSMFQYMDVTDSLSLAWIDTKNDIIYKNQSDYFFGKELTEIISNEFMRLQSHKERSFRLIQDNKNLDQQEGQKFKIIEEENDHEQDENNNQDTYNYQEESKQSIDDQKSLLPSKTIEEFVIQQFSTLQNKRMIQHLVIISPEEYLSKQQFQNTHSIDNIIVTQINLPSELYNKTNIEEFSQNWLSIISSNLDYSRKINIKSIQLSFDLNPYLTNLIDINLINSSQLEAKINKKTQRIFYGQTKSCENLITEEDDQELPQQEQSQNHLIKNQENNHSELKKSMEIQIDFLKKDKIELLFEAEFTEESVLTYTTARLFNCSMQYKFILPELNSLNNSLTNSSNSQSQKLNSSNNSIIQRQSIIFFEEVVQKISNLYLLFEWRQTPQHLCYNKKVMYSFWQHEISNEQIKNSVISNLIYDKYKCIFDAISQKKETIDFEEFNNFRKYYNEN